MKKNFVECRLYLRTSKLIEEIEKPLPVCVSDLTPPISFNDDSPMPDIVIGDVTIIGIQYPEKSTVEKSDNYLL